MSVHSKYSRRRAKTAVRPRGVPDLPERLPGPGPREDRGILPREFARMLAGDVKPGALSYPGQGRARARKSPMVGVPRFELGTPTMSRRIHTVH